MSKNVLHPLFFFLSLLAFIIVGIFSMSTILNFFQQHQLLEQKASLLAELKREENTSHIDRLLAKMASLELCNKEKSDLYQLQELKLINEEGIKRLSFLKEQKISFRLENGIWKQVGKLELESEDIAKIMHLFAKESKSIITQLKLEKKSSEKSGNTCIECYIEFQST